MPFRCATMLNAQRYQHRRHGFGSFTPRGAGGGAWLAAEACVAGVDRAAEQRWSGHGLGHGGDGQVEDLRVALAGGLMAEGVDGLLRDRTRPPAIAPLARSLVDTMVALTLESPGHQATHWMVRAMAKAVASWYPRW